MHKRFIVSSAPHWKTAQDTPRLLRGVLIALVPPTLSGLVFFGARALFIVVVSVASAVGSEWLYQREAGRTVTVRDGSAVVTGLLLALNMPAGVPLWLPAIGSAFAIIVVKQLFGGLGSNFMNPALAARAMLLMAWPVHMTTRFLAPFDGATSATPLALMKGVSQGQMPSLFDLLIGNRAGCIGETSVAALALGVVFMFAKRIIDWRTPTGFVGAFAPVIFVFGGTPMFKGDVVRHLLTGGLVLGAFYMATDYVTTPVTPAGRFVFGAGCGVITAVIRLFGGYPEGVSYAVLLMNVATPLLDRITVPIPLGGARTRH